MPKSNSSNTDTPGDAPVIEKSPAAEFDEVRRFFEYALHKDTQYVGTTVFHLLPSSTSSGLTFSVQVDGPKQQVTTAVNQTPKRATCVTTLSRDDFFLVYSGKASAAAVGKMCLAGRIKVKGWKFRELQRFAGAFDMTSENWIRFYDDTKQHPTARFWQAELMVKQDQAPDAAAAVQAMARQGLPGCAQCYLDLTGRMLPSVEPTSEPDIAGPEDSKIMLEELHHEPLSRALWGAPQSAATWQAVHGVAVSAHAISTVVVATWLGLSGADLRGLPSAKGKEAADAAEPPEPAAPQEEPGFWSWMFGSSSSSSSADAKAESEPPSGKVFATCWADCVDHAITARQFDHCAAFLPSPLARCFVWGPDRRIQNVLPPLGFPSMLPAAMHPVNREQLLPPSAVATALLASWQPDAPVSSMLPMYFLWRAWSSVSGCALARVHHAADLATACDVQADVFAAYGDLSLPAEAREEQDQAEQAERSQAAGIVASCLRPPLAAMNSTSYAARFAAKFAVSWLLAPKLMSKSLTSLKQRAVAQAMDAAMLPSCDALAATPSKPDDTGTAATADAAGIDVLGAARKLATSPPRSSLAFAFADAELGAHTVDRPKQPAPVAGTTPARSARSSSDHGLDAAHTASLRSAISPRAYNVPSQRTPVVATAPDASRQVPAAALTEGSASNEPVADVAIAAPSSSTQERAQETEASAISASTSASAEVPAVAAEPRLEAVPQLSAEPAAITDQGQASDDGSAEPALLRKEGPVVAAAVAPEVPELAPLLEAPALQAGEVTPGDNRQAAALAAALLPVNLSVAMLPHAVDAITRTLPVEPAVWRKAGRCHAPGSAVAPVGLLQLPIPPLPAQDSDASDVHAAAALTALAGRRGWHRLSAASRGACMTGSAQGRSAWWCAAQSLVQLPFNANSDAAFVKAVRAASSAAASLAANPAAAAAARNHGAVWADNTIARHLQRLSPRPPSPGARTDLVGQVEQFGARGSSGVTPSE